MDFDGYRVLTDPLLTNRVAHLRRRRPAPAAEVFDVDLLVGVVSDGGVELGSVGGD